MALAFRAIFTNKIPTTSLLTRSPTHFFKPLNSPFSTPNSRTHFTNYTLLAPSQPRFLLLTKTNASSNELYGTSRSSSTLNIFNFDVFLSVIEVLSLVSSAAISVYVALSCGVTNGGIFAWQCVVLVTGVLVGAVIRRRQWRRICGGGFSRGSATCGVNFLGRVEKLEEDLRSSATIIRVLSRQLEKLETRVRVIRKALKEPIYETAALAQKTSEATRALAAQEDVLEKELGEIQKVLLAMQEQQQKQLELILAIGKSRNLWDNKSVPDKHQNASETSKSSQSREPNLEINQNETLGVATANQQ